VEVPSRAAAREALPGIIGALHAAGYRFVTVSELLRHGADS
jgi:peptidoglycan/xylan/chitin deacetylase (PgdA/CDA1 family)